MSPRSLLLALLLPLAFAAAAADFAHPGAPPPAGIDEVARILREDPYDMELLISYGTSKGGSAGHLALALREPGSGDDVVHSANYYADRKPEHEGRFYTDALITAVPKMEYLFGTSSSLGEKASFGLDFGEVYKRSVIGIRVSGVPAAERRALGDFFARINADYRRRARGTDYHDEEIRYDYLRFNCAKSIGSAFKLAAGYDKLEVTAPRALSGRRVVAAARANVPTEMAMKLVREWHARGYGLDVVLYRKFPGSTYADPREEEPVAFRDLPDRFPSVKSRDFRRAQGEYRDPDNLYAMHLLRNLAKYSVRVDGEARRVVIDRTQAPMAYAEAAKLAQARAAAGVAP